MIVFLAMFFFRLFFKAAILSAVSLSLRSLTPSTSALLLPSVTEPFKRFCIRCLEMVLADINEKAKTNVYLGGNLVAVSRKLHIVNL